MKRFIAYSDGHLEEVGKFAVHFHIEAKSKTDALAKLAAFAARTMDYPARLKTRNGAWQLATPTMEGWNVSAGVDGRSLSLCDCFVKDHRSITDETASFAYYASEDYQTLSRA